MPRSVVDERSAKAVLGALGFAVIAALAPASASATLTVPQASKPAPVIPHAAPQAAPPVGAAPAPAPSPAPAEPTGDAGGTSGACEECLGGSSGPQGGSGGSGDAAFDPPAGCEEGIGCGPSTGSDQLDSVGSLVGALFGAPVAMGLGAPLVTELTEAAELANVASPFSVGVTGPVGDDDQFLPDLGRTSPAGSNPCLNEKTPDEKVPTCVK
jgi:hypothetical protein